MSTATSHGSPGSGAAVPPLRREVLVDAGRATWRSRSSPSRSAPGGRLGDFSVHGAGATVAFVDPGVGGRIVESRDGAEDAVWGTVSRWEPGRALAFTWHPGHGHESASRVTVTFEETDGKTLVLLEHSGWEVFGERAADGPRRVRPRLAARCSPLTPCGCAG